MEKIALLGRMRSGKDTVAHYLVAAYDYEEFKLSGGIKRVVDTFFSDEESGLDKRGLYQAVGQLMRSVDDRVWIKDMLNRIQRSYGSKIVISDVRQENEVEQLRHLGYKIVKVESNHLIRINRILGMESYRAEAFNHETELSVDTITPDFTITNDGTLDELYEKIDQLMKEEK